MVTDVSCVTAICEKQYTAFPSLISLKIVMNTSEHCIHQKVDCVK